MVPRPQVQETMAGVLTGFGGELRSERERRGISMERLSAETKVNPRHFDALERGDYRALPGGVFRRGIVRAYLGAVGLEQSEWLARFEASYAAQSEKVGTEQEQAEEAWATFAENVKRNRAAPKPRNTERWLGVVALFLLLLAASWAVWHYVLEGRVQRPRAMPSATSPDPSE
jgi:cytoskeleton protein RodZ